MISIRMNLFCLLFLWTLTGLIVAQGIPEELRGARCSQRNAILLPSSNKCVVPVQTPMNWTQGQVACEQAGGSLYKMPASRLYSRPDLMDCLSSMDGFGYRDMWINGVSLWFPQFFWNNATILNKVAYCPSELPPTNKKAPMTSDYLSVDYCVSTCFDQGAKYTILYTNGPSPRCNCITELDSKYMVPCPSPLFNYAASSKSFIVYSKEDSLIKVDSADLFSATEVTCATVDSNTLYDRNINSDSCFTQKPFVCELGTQDKCVEEQQKIPCNSQQCLFTCGNKCLKRVGLSYDWYAARSFCASLDGDLWNMVDIDDMRIAMKYLDGASRYWIGASNYAWDFNARSSLAMGLQIYKKKLRCGHMFREVDNGSATPGWTWSDGDCGQQRAFLCEFDSTSSATSNQNQNVVCPWKNPVSTVSQNHPCLQQRSIKMPSSNKCLVPFQTYSTWIEAQTRCERDGGSLYTMPSARLQSSPELDCLSSLKGYEYDNMWLNGISLWSSQFIWTNTSIVNKVKYCPTEMPPTISKAPLTSNYLSLDYCVSSCNDLNARFTILYTTGASPKCNCISYLDSKYMVPCSSPVFNFNGDSPYYIVEANENSLIRIDSSDLFSATEIMCATVDSDTIEDREMKSDLCFTQKPFICELGPAAICNLEAEAKIPCTPQQCRFICGNKCLKRMSSAYNWYAAKRYCSTLGGDLWNMEDMDDMIRVSEYLDRESRYWIGASNHAWNFNATSSIASTFTKLNWKLRCGHMNRKSTSSVFSRAVTWKWTWSDSDCEDKKSFLCEYDFSQSSQINQASTCPW